MEKYLILFIIAVVIYVIFTDCVCSQTVENFSTTTQLSDLEAIRTLALAARDLQKGGLTVQGNLNVRDKLQVSGTSAILPSAKNRPSNFQNRSATEFNDVNGNNAIIGHTYVGGNLIVEGTDSNLTVNNNADINGILTTKNETRFKGATHGNPDRMQTHFPNNDGFNYIRGSTNMLGNFKLEGNANIIGNLCIGNTCINESHLRMIANGFLLQSIANGHNLNRWIHTHGDGRMAAADSVYKTTYRMFPV